MWNNNNRANIPPYSYVANMASNNVPFTSTPCNAPSPVLSFSSSCMIPSTTTLLPSPPAHPGTISNVLPSSLPSCAAENSSVITANSPTVPQAVPQPPLTNYTNITTYHSSTYAQQSLPPCSETSSHLAVTKADSSTASPEKTTQNQPLIAPADSTVSSTTDDQISSAVLPLDSPTKEPPHSDERSPPPGKSEPEIKEDSAKSPLLAEKRSPTPPVKQGRGRPRGSRNGSRGGASSSRSPKHSSVAKVQQSGKLNIHQLVEKKVKIAKLMAKYFDAVKKEQDYFILSQLGACATNDLVDGLCRQKVENRLATSKDHIDRFLLKKEAQEAETNKMDLEDLLDYVMRYVTAPDAELNKSINAYMDKVAEFAEPIIKEMKENVRLRKDIESDKSPLHGCAPAQELLGLKMELVMRNKPRLGPIYGYLQLESTLQLIRTSVELQSSDGVKQVLEHVKKYAAEQLRADGLKVIFKDGPLVDREDLFLRAGFVIEELCIAIVNERMKKLPQTDIDKSDSIEIKGTIRLTNTAMPYTTLVPNFASFFNAYSKAATERGRLLTILPIVRVLRDQMLFPFLFELVPELQSELSVMSPAKDAAACAKEPASDASLRIDDMRWQLPESKGGNYRQRQCLELATHWHAVRSQLHMLLQTLDELHRSEPPLVRDVTSGSDVTGGGLRCGYQTWLLKKKLTVCISSSCEALMSMKGSNFDWQYLTVLQAYPGAMTSEQWSIYLAKVIMVELLIDLLVTGGRNQVWKDGAMKFLADHLGILRLFIDVVTEAQSSIHGYAQLDIAQRGVSTLHEVRQAMIRHVGMKLPCLKSALESASFLGIDSISDPNPVGLMQAQQKLYMLKSGFTNAIFQDITGNYTHLTGFEGGMTDGNNLDDNMSILMGRLFGYRAGLEWATALYAQVDHRNERLASTAAVLRSHCTQFPVEIAVDALRYVLRKQGFFDNQDFLLVQNFVQIATQNCESLTGKLTADDIYRTVLKYREVGDCANADCCQATTATLPEMIQQAKPEFSCPKRDVLRVFLDNVLRQPMAAKPVSALQESLNNVEKKASLDDFVSVQRILLCLDRKDPYDDIRSHMAAGGIPAVVGPSTVVMLPPNSSSHSNYGGGRSVLPTPPPAHQNPTYAPLSALLADTKPPSIMNLDTGLYSSGGRSYHRSTPAPSSSSTYSAGAPATSQSYSSSSYMKREPPVPQEYESYKRHRGSSSSDPTSRTQEPVSPYIAPPGASSYASRSLTDPSVPTGGSEQSLPDTLSSALSSTVYPLPAHVTNVFRNPFNPPYM